MNNLKNHDLVKVDFKEILFEKRPCLDKDGTAIEGLFNAWIILHNPKQYNSYTTAAIKEIILALSPTIEGQTTIHFIQEILRPYNLQISQLAHGIPNGGELEYLDSNTIGSALLNRATLNGFKDE